MRDRSAFPGSRRWARRAALSLGLLLLALGVYIAMVGGLPVRFRAYDRESMKALAGRIQTTFREHPNKWGEPNWVPFIEELRQGSFWYQEDGSGFHLGPKWSFDALRNVLTHAGHIQNPKGRVPVCAWCEIKLRIRRDRIDIVWVLPHYDRLLRVPGSGPSG